MTVHSHSSRPLPAIRGGRPEQELDETICAAWLIVDAVCGQAGRSRDRIRRERDERFGARHWRQAWQVDDGIVGRAGALARYEDAYVEHFRNHPRALDWITETASDVYDNATSNVDSGFDYGVQETPATHLQDIAVRRAVARLGRSFRGNHLVEIRKRDSAGYRLNPGLVAYHRPSEIVDSGLRRWWQPHSIEAFWQHNKVLLVDPAAVHVRPLFLDERGLWCSLDAAHAILVPAPGERRTCGIKRAALRRLNSSNRRERRCAKIVDAPSMSVAALVALAVRPPTRPTPARIRWGEIA